MDRYPVKYGAQRRGYEPQCGGNDGKDENQHKCGEEGAFPLKNGTVLMVGGILVIMEMIDDHGKEGHHNQKKERAVFFYLSIHVYVSVNRLGVIMAVPLLPGDVPSANNSRQSVFAAFPRFFSGEGRND